MNRRDFLGATGFGLLATACGGSQLPHVCDCDDDDFLVATLPAIPDHLSKQMTSLLVFLREQGWLDLIGWSDAPKDPLAQPYFDRRRVPDIEAFHDFAGHRAIHPGRPELSLLYHALASRRATVANKDEESYPRLEDLDVLENFIYALHQPRAEYQKDYALAVMAYEYRPAAQTPHGYHADLVFSRTGIARIGSQPINYLRKTREFANYPRDKSDSTEFAVTGARFALFLARTVGDEAIQARTEERDDAKRTFLLPERKLFSGDLLLEGATIKYSQQHISERLSRLARYKVNGSPLPVLPDRHDKPPFRRVSTAIDDQPATGSDPTLVTMEPYGASVVISSVPNALVRPAVVDGTKERARFEVPGDTKGVSRQYTTLELDYASVTSTIAEGIALRRRQDFIQLRRPNDAPMLVNIRDEVEKATGRPVKHLETPHDADRIAKGGYWAGLFEDSICDGCVAAAFRPVPKRPRFAALGQPPLSAYSIVTAPDFFPSANGLELDEENETLSGNFLKGGTIPLASVRLPPNRNITNPVTNAPAFPADDEVGDTSTAVITRDSKLHSKNAKTPDGDRRSGFLPDSASGVFYPGWDVTYDAVGAHKFLTTYGLGSPFLEDAKLCAAANGMWPAASPDGARTFQGSLLAVARTFGYYYSKTATPLTDAELGYHPQSPAGRNHGPNPRRGWDGEYGPFFEPNGQDFWVNYADIAQVDLVKTAGAIDASMLRGLTTGELIRRMDALRRALRLLDSNHEVYQTPLWLISFEPVDWTTGAVGAGIPQTFPKSPSWSSARPKIAGNGYLLVFVLPISLDKADPTPAGGSRLRRRCEEIHIAQVSATAVSTASWEAKHPPATLKWNDPD